LFVLQAHRLNSATSTQAQGLVKNYSVIIKLFWSTNIMIF